MAEYVLNYPDMASKEYLEDVTIRERQLEAHLLHSPEYLRRADQELKRQVSMLYLAIALLLVFQGLFAWKTAGEIPLSAVALTTITSLLAIINCLLLIRTKACLRRLNDSWLRPEERSAVCELRNQRSAILTYQSTPLAEHDAAHLN
jgi:hypothetical protein